MADFYWRGNEEFTKEYQYQTLVTEFEKGPEQRRAKQPLRRVFRLPFTQFKEDADEIINFYHAQHGRLESFTWENPDTGEVITVRFMNDKLSRKRIRGFESRFTIDLIEVLNE